MMRLGINYPWFKYGWDFGPPPDGWGNRAEWRNVIRRDLDRFRRCGVNIVRWFILGDGITYGTGNLAPRRDGNQWRFHEIPGVNPEVLEDFSDLLSLFQGTYIQLLPVLIDYLWAFPGLDRETHDQETLERWYGDPSTKAPRNIPPGHVKGGRSDVIYDERKCTAFYRNVLVPFLEVSRRYSSAIYAWELINEPEWITRQPGLGGGLSYARRIPLDRMLTFVQEGIRIIHGYGFRPTIGFTGPRVLADWDYRSRHAVQRMTMRRIHRRASELELGFNQIHYYPRGGELLVPANNFPNGMPAIIGEFATRVRGSPNTTRDIPGTYWPDLAADNQSIEMRLRRAQDQGYAAALAWSYRATDDSTEPDFSTTEAALRRFSRE